MSPFTHRAELVVPWLLPNYCPPGYSRPRLEPQSSGRHATKCAQWMGRWAWAPALFGVAPATACQRRAGRHKCFCWTHPCPHVSSLPCSPLYLVSWTCTPELLLSTSSCGTALRTLARTAHFRRQSHEQEQELSLSQLRHVPDKTVLRIYPQLSM